ncbi:MAG: hypothetical protein IM568_12520 [Flavobacterium sp.]|nr:hypothetical protein [Flavobacterium sp.]
MKIEKNTNTFFKNLIPIYLLVGFIAFSIRFYFNFYQELIPGVNGGYYPLQVRSILTNGHLGFSDMPLLFYFDAFLIKFLSIFGFSITDTLILSVVKIVDSISIPLLLLPLYKIIQLSNPLPLKTFKSSILAFSVLSFSPLVLTSDLQKNAFAIVFLLCFLAYYLTFQFNKNKINIFLSVTFLIFTGLTHFGTFVFALFFLFLMVFYTYKKKAIIPMTILISISLGIVFLIDISRFNRLVSFWNLIFEKPAILNGMLSPPDFLIILISIALAIIGIITLKTNSNNLKPFQKTILFASTVCLIAFSFPLLDGEYFKRLSLFLFIPQTLLIVGISSVISVKKHIAISIFLSIFTLISMLAVIGHPKDAVIDDNAYKELKELNSVIRIDNETIVIARHGLEWWAAWALHSKVGQDKAIDSVLYNKYRKVIFINQISGFSEDIKNTPFHEPIIPRNSEMIFSSEYFKVFKFTKNQ